MKDSKSAYCRHDISDETWTLLEPHLPGRKGAWGGIAGDNRRFIDAVFWILRTGAPWRDLPPEHGGWSNTHCPYDKHFYKLRHLGENAFLHLKRWRGIAARYAKNSASFLAALQIRRIALWLKIS